MKNMKRLIILMGLVFASTLSEANTENDKSKKMEFIQGLIASADLNGIEHLLDHIPFTQAEIDACIAQIDGEIDVSMSGALLTRFLVGSGCYVALASWLNYKIKELNPSRSNLSIVLGKKDIFFMTTLLYWLDRTVDYLMNMRLETKFDKLREIRRRLIEFLPQAQSDLLEEPAAVPC